MKKLCEVSEMELKTHTPFGIILLEKIKFKFLHYIQQDFIRQRPELNKDQISFERLENQIMFKRLVINYFILKYCHTF